LRSFRVALVEYPVHWQKKNRILGVRCENLCQFLLEKLPFFCHFVEAVGQVFKEMDPLASVILNACRLLMVSFVQVHGGGEHDCSGRSMARRRPSGLSSARRRHELGSGSDD
jgi:hypothetical protein